MSDTKPTIPDLLPCERCGVVPNPPFENLRDEGEDDPPVQCWTVVHGCRHGETIIEGQTREDCAVHWNARALNTQKGG